MSDETGSGDEADRPEPSEQSDRSPLSLSGCAEAGCLGAVVGILCALPFLMPRLSGGLNIPSGGAAAAIAFPIHIIMRVAPGAAAGAHVAILLWLWIRTRL